MNVLRSSELTFALLSACALKMTVLLGFAWMVTTATRNRSAAFRHLVWALAILGSLTLPVLTLLLPAWHSTALGNVPGLLVSPHEIAVSSNSESLLSIVVDANGTPALVGTLASWALFLWGVGFLVVSSRLTVGLARLAWVSAHAKPLLEQSWTGLILEISKRFGIANPVRVLQCNDQAAMPVTWGIFRPVILLPAGASDWPEVRRRIVLCHELAHIARADWVLQIFAEVARGFYWFHPFAWMAARRLRQESECACDDLVLQC